MGIEASLALAGIFQCADLSRALAREGRTSFEPRAVEATLNSIFLTDPESPADVFGDVGALAPGLRCAVRHLDSGPRDPEVLRYVVSLIHLRGRLMAQHDVSRQLSNLIDDAKRQRDEFGVNHPQTIARLADIYQQTISTLGPRITVRGDGTYLQQASIVNHIRAALLAGVRAAVLWHQLGGRRRQLLLSRGRICRECGHLLDQAPS